MEKDSCPWCGSPITHEKFSEIQRRIRADESKKAAATESALRKRLEEEHRQELQAVHLAHQKKMEEELGRCLKVSQAQAEGIRLKELVNQRTVIDKEHKREILKKEAEFNRRLEAAQKKVIELDHKLKRQAADEIGDGAEIDLYEELKEAFPEDGIQRVEKGQPGADIIQDVRYKGQVCGRIIIDSKNRQAWQDRYVTKLREDKVEADADHAILCTSVFPSGTKELHIDDKIIIVVPARVRHIVDLLRRWAIALHVKGLSITDRAGKMQRLYQYITSERYAQCVTEACRLTQDILDLDVKEENTHRNVWRERGTLTKRLSGALRDLDTEVGAIIEASGDPKTSAA